MLVNRGLGRVLGDLSALGYDARWIVMGAADVGANHQRDRIWIVGKMAYAKCGRGQAIKQFGSESRTAGDSCGKRRSSSGIFDGASWWQAEPNVGRVADGVAARVDRLKAIGNGQVPLCAATAWKLLGE